MHQCTLDGEADDEKRQQDDPESSRSNRRCERDSRHWLSRRADARFVDIAVGSLAEARRIIAQQPADRRQCDDADGDREQHVCHPPTVGFDHRLNEQGPYETADANAGQRDAKGKTTATIEPERDDSGERDVRRAERERRQQKVAEVETPNIGALERE